MAGDSDWLARTWDGKRAQLENINAKISGQAGALDLSPADVTAIENLCVLGMAIIDYQTQAQAGAQGTTQWRDSSFEAPRGGTVAAPPAGAAWAAPAGTKIGILPELRYWREKILAASKYEAAIGEDLMLVKADGGTLDPSTVKPTLVAHAAEVGLFGYAVIITGRGDSDQWKLSGAPFGSSGWQELGTFTGKSFEGVWPGGGSNPIQIQLRAQLYRKNEPYGIPSDIVVITVIP